MTTTPQREYGIMAVTSYYGPRYERRLVASDLTEEAARQRAAEYRPDWSNEHQATVLAHNQSAGTIGVPVEILRTIDPTKLADLIDATTEARAAEICREQGLDPEDGDGWDEAVQTALAERGEYVLGEYRERDMGDGYIAEEWTGGFVWVRRLAGAER